MLTIYGRATSSNVQAVMWGAAELGLSPERLDYGHVHGGTDTPEFRAMSPHGLVPVLKDGDIVVWESCAILRYLAAAYGDGGAFWPADPAARAPVDMWAEWGKVSFASAFVVPIFWARVRTAAARRDRPRSPRRSGGSRRFSACWKGSSATVHTCWAVSSPSPTWSSATFSSAGSPSTCRALRARWWRRITTGFASGRPTGPM